MRVLKRIGLVLVILVGLFIIVGLFLPSSYAVERSIIIDAPASVVFAEINDLKKMRAWSPWEEADPTLETRLGEVTVGKGATLSWTSEHSGSGTMEIVDSVPDRSVELRLDFDGMGSARSTWRLEPSDGGVKTTWGFEGDAGWDIPGRYFGLAMDSMVGPIYAKGLANLKRVAEAAASATPEPGSAPAVEPEPAGPNDG